MRVIFEAKPDGGTQICVPVPRTLAALTGGGFGFLPGDADTSDLKEDEARRIAVAQEMPVERAIANMVRAGHDPDFAAHWTMAQLVGGENSATALDLIARNAFPDPVDVVAGYADAVPGDRFFRDAWRREPGGDKIFLELEACRVIFGRRVIGEKNKRALKLIAELDALIVAGKTDQALEAEYETLIAMDLRALGAKVMQASSADELRALWPAALEATAGPPAI
jgi:hypothetical protein